MWRRPAQTEGRPDREGVNGCSSSSNSSSCRERWRQSGAQQAALLNSRQQAPFLRPGRRLTQLKPPATHNKAALWGKFYDIGQTGVLCVDDLQEHEGI